MKKHIRFIINPISGIGQKKILPNLIDKYLDKDVYTYDIVFTEDKGHATELAREAVKEGVDVVCAVGGDGSVNEVGSALVNTSTSLAILPTGSGNGLARHLKMSLKLKKAIKNLNTAKPTSIDTIKINDKIFLGVAGFGFDALIADRFDKYHSRGFMSYAKLVLTEFRKYKGISIRINDGECQHDLLFCTFANASQFGNGFVISPHSRINDNKFEIICIRNPNYLGFLKLLWRSYFGSIHKSSSYFSMEVNSAKIETEEKYAHIDGEPVTFDKSILNLNTLPKSLQILVGK
ncbi:MAG: diacylglycerol kinase family lipid kinase [Brumimicrobium sp.]|nr:diacylglycerol kinase family lipid kinase [Brumimicrobium sp.]